MYLLFWQTENCVCCLYTVLKKVISGFPMIGESWTPVVINWINPPGIIRLK
jgi:hypothetical protein